MAKFHLNPETGDPGPCRARRSCPFGDLETEHFPTPDAARRAYEARQESAFVAVGSQVAGPSHRVQQIIRKEIGLVGLSSFGKDSAARMLNSLRWQERLDPHMSAGKLLSLLHARRSESVQAAMDLDPSSVEGVNGLVHYRNVIAAIDSAIMELELEGASAPCDDEHSMRVEKDSYCRKCGSV